MITPRSFLVKSNIKSYFIGIKKTRRNNLVQTQKRDGMALEPDAGA